MQCSDLEPFVVDTVHRFARLATLLIFIEKREPVFLTNPILFLVYTSSVDITHRIAHASLTDCDIMTDISIPSKDLAFVILRDYRDQLRRVVIGVKELITKCHF